jgi:hypothetical protein
MKYFWIPVRWDGVLLFEGNTATGQADLLAVCTETEAKAFCWRNNR